MKYFFGITFIGLALALTGCKEQGCTDVFADNYVETAEEDDGSCSYGVNLIFYFNEARANHYYDAGAFSPMHVVVNGTDVGHVNWFSTYETAPECEPAAGCVNYTLNMSNKFEDVEIEYVDQMGTSFGTTTVNVAISEGDCKAILF